MTVPCDPGDLSAIETMRPSVYGKVHNAIVTIPRTLAVRNADTDGPADGVRVGWDSPGDGGLVFTVAEVIVVLADRPGWQVSVRPLIEGVCLRGRMPAGAAARPTARLRPRSSSSR